MIWAGDFSATRAASLDANELLFGGYRFDAETGLYHVLSRWYHVPRARWVGRDPEGYVDGMSLYAYCGGRPLIVSPYAEEMDFAPDLLAPLAVVVSRQRV